MTDAERIESLRTENARLKAAIGEVMTAYELASELHASWEDCAGNMHDRLKLLDEWLRSR
jgi:hypothetical protein